MTILSRPAIARTAARVMQGGMQRNEHALTEQAMARMPEVPRRTEELSIPTALGPAAAVVYRPQTDEPAPAVYVNLHGGGFVMRLFGPDDPACRLIAAGAGVVVVNVDYVVAPQHPFPQPVDQVAEIVSWVAEHGAEHGWDGSRLVVGGQSAGGALAAAAARLAFERGTPRIALQVLHYPPLDLTVPAGAKHSPLPKPMLRPWMGEIFDASYVPDRTQRADRLVSPAGAADRADLRGIAPAVVVAAGADILRDEARRYADRLASADALVEYWEVPGADHAYDQEDDAAARDTYGRIAAHVRAAVGAGGPGSA